jgi:plasmid stabilization system protein ParE
MFQVSITALAERDIEAAFAWWRDHRSPEEAERWLDAIYPAIDRLAVQPRSCARVPEMSDSKAEVRQLLFGTGRAATHRVIFSVCDELVTVLRVYHTSRDFLNLD